MMGATHAALGAVAGTALAMALRVPVDQLPPVLAAAVIASLLPDIDHPKAAIRQKLGIAGHMIFFWLRHRGITHTALVWGLVHCLALIALPQPLALAISAGYASHLLSDCLTLSGLPLLMPLTDRMVYLLPRPFRIRTGSLMESVFFLAIVAAGVWLAAEQSPALKNAILSVLGRWL